MHPSEEVLPYFPWMKDWGPPHNLRAMVPELSPQHRAFNLGLWGTPYVAQLWAGNWMPWNREPSCTAGSGIPCSHWVWYLKDTFALLLRHIRSAVRQIPNSTVREQYSLYRYLYDSQGGGSVDEELVISYNCGELEMGPCAAHELCHSTVCKLSS